MNKFAPRPLPVRFREKYVVAESGCWQWIGAIDSAGYGRIRAGERLDGAHRVSWQLAKDAPVPDGLHILHRCNNKLCVNPDHLYAGTQADNTRDAIRDGLFTPGKYKRTAPYVLPDNRGALNPRAKILPGQVQEIKQRYSAGGISQQKLADEYGVEQTTISQITRGATWTSL